MTVQILVGDCRDRLGELAPGIVHTCITSPPYWGLRDYGTEPLQWPAITYSPLPGLPPCVDIPAMSCSLGLEPTLEAFIGHMVLVYRGVRRVLRDDGTAWVNMGDSYAGNRGTAWGPSPSSTNARGMTASRRRDDVPIPRSDVAIPGLKPKDLVGQPWRLALALQADGWWLRQDVIWAKPNPMPESIKDRCTKAHEYIFLLAKSERYYFDHDAIKEPASENTNARRATVAGWASGDTKHSAIAHAQEKDSRGSKYGGLTGQNTDGEHRTKANLNRGVGWGHGTDAEERARGRVRRVDEGAYGDGKSERLGRGAGWRKLADPDSGTKNNDSFDAAMAVMPENRAKRSVWTVTTEGFPGAHFATFPTKLIEPCILAGCPVGGLVLDCFGGSGTTGLVADRLQRDAILCELNPAYADMARARVQGDAPLFTSVQLESATE